MFAARSLGRAIRTPAARGFVTRTVLQRPSIFNPTWKRSSLFIQTPRLAAPFSSALRAFGRQGDYDEELALKLQSELEIEQNDDELEGEMPLDLQEYLQSSPFNINDKPGQEDVELVRKFGDETIRVVFSIAELTKYTGNDGLANAAEEEDLYDDDSAGEHGGRGRMQSGGAQSARAKDEGRVAKDQEDLDDYEEDLVPQQTRLHVTIEKPNQGALQIETVFEDGTVIIEGISYYKNASLATAKSVEANWERQSIYPGPDVSLLDEDLQILFENYLEERGINTSLALFVPGYVEWKEQREYERWLENVKNFVEA